MPTVLRVSGYRFYFYSHEPNEPPHVHVDQAEKSAKIWLTPVSLARNIGFRSKDLTGLLGLVRTHRDELLERWNDFFGNSR